jgi:tetratricopeptide (TPR) repeat protein
LLMGQGNLADARRHLEAALDLAGNQLTTESATTYLNLGWVLLQESDPQRAASYFADALRTARLNGIVWLLPYSVLGLACCETYRGEFERAARLHGGADAWFSAGSAQWETLEKAIRAQDIAVLRERLGDDFERHYESGRAMPPDEIVKLALTSY